MTAWEITPTSRYKWAVSQKAEIQPFPSFFVISVRVEIWNMISEILSLLKRKPRWEKDYKIVCTDYLAVHRIWNH